MTTENLYKDTPNLAPARIVRDTNLAYCEHCATAPKSLTVHSKKMAQVVYEPVPDRVFVSVGYGLCSTTMIVGNDGIIIIDPGENDEQSAAVMKEFRQITDKPIRGVIYTHRHPDHCFAVRGLGVTDEDVASGKVEIFAHSSFMYWLLNDSSVVGPALSVRAWYTVGGGLPVGPEGRINNGIGPVFNAGHASFIPPTKTFDDTLDVEIAGVKMHLFYAYGDAEDEIDVWLPEWQHVHGSETIQGTAFPNMHTIRGTKFRDPIKWYGGIDNLLKIAREANSYSGSHGRAFVGNDYIVERIQNYRDAIQYVHDQSVRHINMGYTPDELAEVIKLPPHLAEDPWLGEFYGTVNHAARQAFYGYLGFFKGDVTELATPGHVEKSRLYMEALGGREQVLALGQQAIASENYGWAMELLTHPIRVDKEDMEARKLKAEAMRQWGFTVTSINWRGFALMGAAELEGELKATNLVSFIPPDVARYTPARNIIETLPVRLDAEKAKDVQMALAFDFTDMDEQYSLEIRQGVAVFSEGLAENAVATLQITHDVFIQFLLGEIGRDEAITSGEIKVAGDQAKALAFFTYFDPPGVKVYPMVVR